MQKTLFVAAALIGSLNANSFFRAPTTEALAVTSRNFTVVVGDNGAYRVPVDFLNQKDEKDAAKLKPSHNFLLSLYSSQQVFVGESGDKSCFAGMKGAYDCGVSIEKVCEKTGTPATFVTPYFKFNAQPIKAELYAEYSSWALNKEAAAVQTISCDAETDKVNTAMFKDAEGIWGLGFEGTAKSNFVNSTKNFWLNFNGTSLNIAFSDAKEYVPSAGFVEKRWSVKTDGNWKASAKSVNILELKHEAPLKVIFDVNTKTNGFPKAVYDKVLEAIDKIAKCEKVDTTPKCENKIKASQLGNLTIVVDDTQKIILSAYDLIVDYTWATEEYSNFKLNIRALSKDLKGENFVADGGDNANTIIIGQRSLSGYSTVFNVEDSTVTQYYVNLDALLKAIGSIIKWIIIAIVGSIIVCCLCVCFCCGGTAWIVAKLGKKDKQDNYYQSSQTDPFVARK